MRVRLILISLCAFLFSCATSQQKRLENKKADVLYSYGTRALVQGRYTDALKNLLDAEKLRPKDADLQNNLAMAYYYKKKPELAKKHLQRAIDLNDKHSDAMINLATIYYTDKDYEKAKKLYEQVATHLLYKKQFITYFNLSKVYYQQSQLQKSLEYAEKAIAEDETYCPALFQKGYVLNKLGFYEKANMAYKSAISGVCYENVQAHYYRAMNLMKLGMWIPAEEIMERIRVDFADTSFAPKAMTQLKLIRQMIKQDVYSKKEQPIQAPRF